ncbi:MAG: hypothetical protein NVS4B3_11170 [Gemmatimonadaceae bacterium]
MNRLSSRIATLLKAERPMRFRHADPVPWRHLSGSPVWALKRAGLLSFWIIPPVGCTRVAPLVAFHAQAARICCTITVDNRNWQDIVVYAVHNGTRTRLGTVTAASQTRFAIGDAVIPGGGSLRFLGHPIGDTRSFLSEAILVQQGQEIMWELESGLERSMLSVR